jgi:NAD(P)-dependent dehydrogenase (short-subunit alcohol dehydrogenase family)
MYQIRAIDSKSDWHLGMKSDKSTTAAAPASELEQLRKALRRFNPRGSAGRRILITGGLGLTGSKVLDTYLDALPHAEICLADLLRDGVEEKWAAHSRVHFIPVNFLEAGSVSSLLDRVAEGGRLTDAIFIHGGDGRPEWEMPGGKMTISPEEVWVLNLESVYELLRESLDRGILRGSRDDIATATAISSLSRFPAWFPPPQVPSDYNVAKDDLYHVMLYLGSRVDREDYVRFHVVSPGTIIDTYPAEIRAAAERRVEKHLPLRSLANGYDIANAILANTELGRKVTGVETRVDGGQYWTPQLHPDPKNDFGESTEVEKGRLVAERLEAKWAARSLPE